MLSMLSTACNHTRRECAYPRFDVGHPLFSLVLSVSLVEFVAKTTKASPHVDQASNKHFQRGHKQRGDDPDVCDPSGVTQGGWQGHHARCDNAYR